MIDDTQFVAQKPDVDYRQLNSQPSPEDFFLLSRVTGVVSVKRLCSVSGLGRDKTLSSIERLVDVGLLDLVEEDGTPVGGADAAISQPAPEQPEPAPEPEAAPEPDPEPAPAPEPSPEPRQASNASGSAPSAGASFDAPNAGAMVEDDDDLFMPSSPAHRAKIEGGGAARSGSSPASKPSPSPAASSAPTSKPELQAKTPDSTADSASDDADVLKAKPSKRPDYSRFPDSLDEVDPPEAFYVDGVERELQREIKYVHDRLDEIDFYQLFGVEEDAGRKEIRKAYFKMSKRFHPDKFFRAEAEHVAEKVEEIFKFVTKGYQTLSKKSKREDYDVALQRARIDAEKESAEHDRKREMAAEMLEKRADQLEEKGDLVGASEQLQKVAALRREPKTLLKAANLLLRANRGVDDAASLARAAAGKMPDAVEPWLLLGRIYEKNHMYDEAVEAFEEAVSLAPEDPTVRVHLERVRSRQ